MWTLYAACRSVLGGAGWLWSGFLVEWELHVSGGCGCGFTGRCHSPVVSSRFPVRTTRSFGSETVHVLAVYTILYPLSQNLRAAISDEWDNLGIMWASVMCAGSHGMSRLHVCVDVRIFPSGMVMCSGVMAGLMLIVGAFSVRKWAVAPVSLMAW